MHLRKLLFATYSVTLALFAVQPVFAQQTVSVGAVSVIANERDGAPASINFGPEASYKASEAMAVFSKYLKLNPATDEMRYKATDKASADVSIARYTQFYKGIKVEHGSYIIAAKNDVISYMSGNFYRPAGTINIQPSITEAIALQKALVHTGAKKYMWEIPGAQALLQGELNDPASGYKPKGELVLIEDYFSGDVPDGILHLAYHFDIYAAEPMSRNDVYVDAVTGRILFTNAIMKHVQASGNSVYSGPVNFEASTNGTLYSLHDVSRGNGIHTYSLGDSTTTPFADEVTSTTTTFASNVALDAHWGATKVYDYWKIKQGRLSYNNRDSSLNSYVDYSRNYDNAFWGGNAMFYGNGSGRTGGGFDPLVSLDICGHEIGHGVCQTTAGLIYNRESGGMNEGFSDIWGAVIENYANPNETDAKAKNNWEIGEEIAASPLRDMSNPTRFKDPDTYGGAHWKFATSSCSPNSNTNDNCGVHSNSGVLNKWFYLLTVGGSGINGVNTPYGVSGIGFDTAAKIAYGTELSLTQTANYAACRTASINYATTQYGACSRAVEAVTRAWYAVNVGADYTTCTPQVSFTTPLNTGTENAASGDCAGSHTISVPIKLNGPAPTGGNAEVTVTVTGGTAVNGVDYTIPSNTVTFPAGSTATQMFNITVLDNGNSLDTQETIDLSFALAANGSNLTPANVLNTTTVVITNDDQVPVAGSTETRAVGTYDVASNITSPFLSNSAQAHIQYIVTAEELLASGIKPNASLTKLGFTVIQKVSTQPFTDFNIQIAPTTTSIFTNAFITGGFVQVYNGSVTTVTGANTLSFMTNYVWDGVSNLAIEICFSNPSRGSGNDQVQGTSASGNRVAYNSNNATNGGCILPFVATNVSNARPIFRFTQDIPPTPIETASSATRKWDVHAGDRTYFYSDSDQELIAGIWNGSNELGCVTATVTQAGVGFVNNTFAPFSNVKRSVKEISITPTQNNDTASYTGLFYLTDAELDGTPATSVLLLKTTAATDADIAPANTTIISAMTRTSGLNYKAFRANMSGFGRYFFIDGVPNLAVGNLSAQGYGIAVINNPFQNELKVAYTMQNSETASVRLLDITGKVVYNAPQPLQSGKGQFTLPVSNLGLAAGHYVLQVVSASGVYTQKVLKN